MFAIVEPLKLLLPALVPSWRFFDWIAPAPRIEILMEGQNDWREWRPRPQSIKPHHYIIRLFWNPQWNDHLFMASCAERLMQNPTDHSEQEIIKRIRHDLRDTTAKNFQFRLVFFARDTAWVTYVSRIYNR